jgi:zinc and cadmium transporter
MLSFVYIILATLAISLISFAGVITFFIKEKVLGKILLFLVAFSAGSLIAAAFFDLLPEALSSGSGENFIMKVFLFVTLGFCAFFVLEQFLMWHHHHSMEHKEIKSFSYLILVSDGIHNFIDGLVIAGSFLVSLQAGMVTVLAVAIHEIPQEIGDFAVLIYGGLAKKKALFFNFISALLAGLGGAVGFWVLRGAGAENAFVLPFTAGGFIYIAASDLIPEIKEEWVAKKSFLHFLVFASGIGVMVLIKLLFEK